jgi:hypothetical protein
MGQEDASQHTRVHFRSWSKVITQNPWCSDENQRKDREVSFLSTSFPMLPDLNIQTSERLKGREDGL